MFVNKDKTVRLSTPLPAPSIVVFWLSYGATLLELILILSLCCFHQLLIPHHFNNCNIYFRVIKIWTLQPS